MEIHGTEMDTLVNSYTWPIERLFDILNAGEFEGSLVHGIASLGKGLIAEMQREFSDLVSFTEKILGGIEILEDEYSSFYEDRAKFKGLVIKPSEVFLSALRGSELKRGVKFKIEMDHERGNSPFLPRLKRMREHVETGLLGLHGNMAVCEKTSREIDQFLNKDLNEVMELSRFFKAAGNDAAQQLMGKEHETEVFSETEIT